MELLARHAAPRGVNQGREGILPELSVRATRSSSGTRITVGGILCIDNAHQLHDLAIEYLSPVEPLFIDIKNTVFADTSCVAVLLHVYAVARRNECVLVIINPVPSARKIIDFMHLEAVLPVSRRTCSDKGDASQHKPGG